MNPESCSWKSIHKKKGGRRGNTTRCMFSFGQLCEWMLRYGVTHTRMQSLQACQLPVSPTLNHPQPHPESSASSAIHLAEIFVLFFRSCFTNSFVKPHKGLLNPVKPSLRKEWKVLFTHRDYKSRGTVRLWAHCTGANDRKPQPQCPPVVVRKSEKWVYVGNSQTCLMLCMCAEQAHAC